MDVHRRQEDADLLPVALGATDGWPGPATITRPSAGDNTASTSEPMTRSGSRKKKARNAASSRTGSPTTTPSRASGQSRQRQRAADEGAPARSIPIMVWWPRPRDVSEHWPAAGRSWRVEDARAATRDTG